MDAMVDIETLSSRPDAAVIAIGLVAFDRRQIVDQLELLINPALSPGHRSVSTLQWWQEQDPGVYAKMTSGDMTPGVACRAFQLFCGLHKVKLLWANPPQFDIVILRYFFEQAGKEFPIHFSKERDFRTLKGLAKRLKIDYQSVYEDRTAHDAVSDAVAQARAVQLILTGIGC